MLTKSLMTLQAGTYRTIETQFKAVLKKAAKNLAKVEAEKDKAAA